MLPFVVRKTVTLRGLHISARTQACKTKTGSQFGHSLALGGTDNELHTDTQTQTHTHAHTDTHRHTHTHMHVHTDTHTNTFSLALPRQAHMAL